MSRHVACWRMYWSLSCSRRLRHQAEWHMIGRDACSEVRPRGADVIDDCSDWMSFHDALAHVEATQKCYEELAIKLLQQATYSLKIRSRTVQSAPRWVQAGDIVYSDNGKDLEFCREDLLKLWPEQQKGAATSRRPRIGSGAISDGVRLAIDSLWPDGVPEGLRAKERNEQVRQWLKDHNKSIPSDLSKAVQRALKRARDPS